MGPPPPDVKEARDTVVAVVVVFAVALHGARPQPGSLVKSPPLPSSSARRCRGSSFREKEYKECVGTLKGDRSYILLLLLIDTGEST